ncbi:MAG: hypothetical protein AAF196_09385 [Planctomycetota bacterium]
MRTHRTALLALLSATASAQDTPLDSDGASRVETTAPAVSRQRFDELRITLQPNPDAPWRSIAWRIDLLAAQREASEANKPLFIWAMDGHPLGCT